jgi:hypothetical protein
MTLDPNFLTLFLYAMVLWDKGHDFLTPKTYLEDNEDMRCTIDGLFGCEHIRKPRMGEAFGDKPSKDSNETKLSTPMPKSPEPKISYPIRVYDDKVRIATDAETTVITKHRILIPPSVRFPSNGTVSVDGTLPGSVKVSSVIRSTTAETSSEEINTKIVCQICQASMDISDITAHIKVHMDDYKPAQPSSSLKDIKPSTALSVIQPSQTNTTSFKPEAPTVRLSSKEQYHSRRISEVSFSSSTGRNGRYSDFSLVLWEPAKTSLNDHTYAHNGYTASYSNDIRRVHIVITYDALEEYYHLGVRLYRKSWYNETNEEAIPERICDGIQELYAEVRRALIYFRINPRLVYRAFRKMQSRDQFVVERDNTGRVIGVETSNTQALMQKLNDTKDTTSQYHGCC